MHNCGPFLTQMTNYELLERNGDKVLQYFDLVVYNILKEKTKFSKKPISFPLSKSNCPCSNTREGQNQRADTIWEKPFI